MTLVWLSRGGFKDKIGNYEDHEMSCLLIVGMDGKSWKLMLSILRVVSLLKLRISCVLIRFETSFSRFSLKTIRPVQKVTHLCRSQTGWSFLWKTRFPFCFIFLAKIEKQINIVGASWMQFSFIFLAKIDKTIVGTSWMQFCFIFIAKIYIFDVAIAKSLLF